MCALGSASYLGNRARSSSRDQKTTINFKKSRLRMGLMPRSEISQNALEHGVIEFWFLSLSWP